MAVTGTTFAGDDTTAFPATQEIARKALMILDRDGWSPDFLTRSHPVWGDTQQWREGSHCIAGLWNMALPGERSSWQFSSELHMASYAPLIAKARELFGDDAISSTGSYHPHSDIYALVDWNNEHATEDDIRRLLTELANG